MRNFLIFLLVLFLFTGCKHQKVHLDGNEVVKGGEVGRECIRHRDCGDGWYCDSLSGYRCKKRCVPDNGEFNTVSKDCPGEDRICRGDGRCSSKYFETVWRINEEDPVVVLGHDGVGKCDFEVDWGDGVVERIVGCSAEKLSHRYDLSKIEGHDVRVKISGVYEGWGFSETVYKPRNQLT